MRGPSLLKGQQVKESNQLGKEAQPDEPGPQRKGGKGTEPGHLRGEVTAGFLLAQWRLLANPALGLSASAYWVFVGFCNVMRL